MAIDHTKFSSGSNPKPKEEFSFWWREKRRPHDALLATVETLRTQQAQRNSSNDLFVRLYGEDSKSLRSFRNANRTNPVEKERITFNVIRSIIDTVMAKIAKSRPKATFVTDGGNFAQRQRAKRLEKFVQGVKHQVKFYPKARRAARDGATCDIGALKWFREGKDIRCERVHPAELLCDDVDGMSGEPRSLFQIKTVAREVLMEQFAGESRTLKKAIEEAESPSWPGIKNTIGDRVMVVEGWHLPSGKGTGDGRHVIAIQGATLLDEAWTRQRFPFSFFRWSERFEGFYGQGIAEQLVPDQLSINKTLKTINAILNLCGAPKWMVHELSGVPDEQFTNAIAQVIRFNGNIPPKLEAFGVVPPELFRTVQDQIDRAYHKIGVSQLSAAAQKPAGIDSRVALREMADQESERFILAHQAYEEFASVDSAEQIIDLAKEIAADEGDLEVAFEDKTGIERIKWSEVNLEEEAYILKVFPTSSLPTTPGARKQAVEELVQGGFIDQAEARRLLDFPDLEASNNVAFAAAEDIEWTIEHFLSGGDFLAPEPYQDLALGLKRFQSAYLRAKRMKAPEEALEKLRTWMGMAETLLTPPAPEAPPAPMADPMLPPGGAPPAPPAPPIPPL